MYEGLFDSFSSDARRWCNRFQLYLCSISCEAIWDGSVDAGPQLHAIGYTGISCWSHCTVIRPLICNAESDACFETSRSSDILKALVCGKLCTAPTCKTEASDKAGLNGFSIFLGRSSHEHVEGFANNSWGWLHFKPPILRSHFQLFHYGPIFFFWGYTRCPFQNRGTYQQNISRTAENPRAREPANPQTRKPAENPQKTCRKPVLFVVVWPWTAAQFRGCCGGAHRAAAAELAAGGLGRRKRVRLGKSMVVFGGA